MLNQFKSVKLPTLPTYLAKTTYFAGIRITEQLLFLMLSSILTFNFDHILGSFLAFGCSNGLFMRLEQSSKTIFRSTYTAKQLSFSLFNSDSWFWHNFWVVFVFLGALIGCFWNKVRFKLLHEVCFHSWTTFISMLPSNLTFNFELIFGSF